jgi:hypothetical protein
LRPLRWSKWIAERDDVSYDEAFQPVHKALEDFKSSHDAEGEPSPIPLVRLGVDETGADRILNVSGNSSSASTKTRSRDSRQPRPQRSKTKAPSRRGDERGRVNSPRSYEIEPCEPPRWQDSPSPYRSKRGRPRPATPSLPRNRVGTAQLRHLQGFLACGDRDLADNADACDLRRLSRQRQGQRNSELQELCRAL